MTVISANKTAVQSDRPIANGKGAVAMLGGTFDPIHHGHLRTAMELIQLLPVDELRLIPCHCPPHRTRPATSSVDRLAMVTRAVSGERRLKVDDRELRREGPSYSVDTLRSLRAELGSARPLLMVIGTDALLGLPTWHAWEQIPDLAHLVIVQRPGWRIPDDFVLAEWLEKHRLNCVDELCSQPSGGVFWQTLTPLKISSTVIRQLLAAGESPRYLIPDAVLDYIREQRLYL